LFAFHRLPGFFALLTNFAGVHDHSFDRQPEVKRLAEWLPIHRAQHHQGSH